MNKRFNKFIFIFVLLGIFLFMFLYFLNSVDAQTPPSVLGKCAYRTRVFIAAGPNDIGELKFQKFKDDYIDLFKKAGVNKDIGDIEEFYSASDLRQKISAKSWQECGPNQAYQDRLLVFIFGHGDIYASNGIYNPDNYITPIKASEVYDILDRNFLVFGGTSATPVLRSLAIPIYITIFGCHSGSWNSLAYRTLREKGLSLSLYVSSGVAEFTWGVTFVNAFLSGVSERLQSLRGLQNNKINSVRDLDIFIFQNAMQRVKIALLEAYIPNPTIIAHIPFQLQKSTGNLMYQSPKAYSVALPVGYVSEDRVVAQ